MADRTLTALDVFPAGTSVGAYKRSNWMQHQLPPAGAPLGSADQTVVATNTGIAFTGLTAETDYYAVGQPGATWRYIAFDTRSPASSGGGAPTGAAGGVLGGTYPNPAFATPQATQAALDAEVSARGAADALLAPKASPALTGTPTAPTASQGTNTTQLGTTQYVQTEVGLLIPKSLVDAKGDLLTATADNVPARLAVGSTDGQVLTVASGQATGLQWATPAVPRAKDYVRVAAIANGTLASAFENGDTIDGVVLATGDRILLPYQTAPAENGIYTVNASGAPTRATDADTWNELVGAEVYVTAGAVNGGAVFRNVNALGGTLNTTALRWTRLGIATGNAWDPALLPTGSFFENMPRAQTNYQRLADTSGTVIVTLGPTIPAGKTLTAVNLYNQTVSAGLTHSWGGIAYGPKEALARQIIAVTADGTSTQWAANAFKVLTLTSAWTPDKDTGIYIFFCQIGTTPGRLVGTGFQTSGIFGNAGGTPIVNGTADTGQAGGPLSVGATLAALAAGADGVPYFNLT